jgi:hypothetical protein
MTSLSLEGDEMTNSNAPRNRSSIEVAVDLKPLEAIGRALRAHYDELLQEPLPARFEELLSKLDAQDEPARRKARNGGE